MSVLNTTQANRLFYGSTEAKELWLGSTKLWTKPSSSSFSPLDLFAGGFKGLWIDPSDFTTMFQNTAGTTPVTGVGQAVALIKDKSGNVVNLSQGVTTKQPLLQQDENGKYYLYFDGVDDFYFSVGTLNLSTAYAFTSFVGMRKLRDSSMGTVFELGVGAGSIAVNAPRNAGVANYSTTIRATAAVEAITAGSYTSPHSAIITASGDTTTSPGSLNLRINGALVKSMTGTYTGPFANTRLDVGCRNGAGFYGNHRLYGLIIVGKACDASTIAQTEQWMANKSGIAL